MIHPNFPVEGNGKGTLLHPALTRIRETTSEEIGMYNPRSDGTRGAGDVLLTNFGTCTLVSLPLRDKNQSK